MEINTLVAQLAPAIGLFLLPLDPEAEAFDNRTPNQLITEVRILLPHAQSYPDCDVLLANGRLTTRGKPDGATLPSDRVLALTWLPGINGDHTSIRLLLQHHDWYKNHTQNLTRTFIGSAAAIATAQETAQRAGVWQLDIVPPLLAPGDSAERA